VVRLDSGEPLKRLARMFAVSSARRSRLRVAFRQQRECPGGTALVAQWLNWSRGAARGTQPRGGGDAAL